MVNKSNIKTLKPYEQIRMEPNFAMIIDLLVDNIDGHVIYFWEEATKNA